MDKEFVMRFMVEFGLDAEIRPADLSSIGLERVMKQVLMDNDIKVDATFITRGLIALRAYDWVNLNFAPMRISLTQKAKDLLKANP